MDIVMFSKMLGDLSVAEMAARIAAIGLDGIDLTVRPGGHVDPSAVETSLPEAIETIETAGLSVPMITTAITDAADPATETIFETADACGVRYLKLGYWRYDGFGTIRDGLDQMATDLQALHAVSDQYTVTPAIHTHSGAFLSANPAMWWDVICDGAPETMGVYVDPGHLCIEGGGAGWEQQLDMVASHVTMVAVKDYVWQRTDDGMSPTWVGVGEGHVPWHEVFDRLAQIGFDGPVSLHAEYHHLDVEAILEQTKVDAERVMAEWSGNRKRC